MTDTLTTLFNLLDLRSARCTRFEAGGEWSLRFPEKSAIKFAAVLKGTCFMLHGDRPPIRLRAGDVLLALDGVTLDSTNTLTRVLDRHYPGDVLDVTWVDSTGVPRDGKAVLTP